MSNHWPRLVVFVIALLLASDISPARAQTIRGVVVDQTGLPLPGATVQLLDGKTVTGTWTTGTDGSFTIEVRLRGSTVEVSLFGFETTRVERVDASRIVLNIGRAEATTEVVADVMAPPSPTSTRIGTALPSSTLARIPPPRMRAREALPLLPSVVRGPDGLLLGGARPYEIPLFIDGFDVSDPATGTSSITLPFETVRGVEALRDPAAINYGGFIGGLMQMDTQTGGDQQTFGVQGFIPRPRFTNPGFGRLEGIFPRAYYGGQAANGRVRYLSAIEYSFERLPVPGVTKDTGPDIVEQSGSVFGRVDVQATPKLGMTLESFVFPSATDSAGLSAVRADTAAIDRRGKDFFAGFISHHIIGTRGVLSLRLGLLKHTTKIVPRGTGLSVLSPAGWRGNWFSRFERRAARYAVTAVFDRTLGTGTGTHDLSLQGRVEARRLHGDVSESPVVVEDALGQRVRSVDFGAPGSVRANDGPLAVSLRDVWRINSRAQVDAGARLDYDGHYGGAAPSARAGLRYTLDEAGTSVVKLSGGTFVGRVPLIVPAFGASPVRTDRLLDPATGRVLSERVLTPTVGQLALPRARAVTAQFERELQPGFDAQIGVSFRESRRLATLEVGAGSGPLTVGSNGRGSYRELQLSARRMWSGDQQLFASYVLSSARGELNDFPTLFQGFDAPLVQPGGHARLATDARHRWVAWGTFNAPAKIVVSPVLEVRSGFRYSALTPRYTYADTPNGLSFPAFVSLDLVIFRPFTARGHTADLGIQLFNATNYNNPRDVYPVVGTPSFGTFANSVGTILRGFMLIKW